MIHIWTKLVVTTLFREQQTYTESVLLHVISTIERALKRPAIMETLDTLEPEVRFWMDKLLSKSTCQTEIVNATAVWITTRGILQGGIMSPLLWNLEVDEIVSNLRGRNIKIIAYADHIMFTTAIEINEMLQKQQTRYSI